MSLDAMKQALEALELLARYENPATKIQVRKPKDGGPIVTMYPHKVATDAAAPLRERLAQPEQQPVAWVYPEGLEALKSGKPWTAYGSSGYSRIPLYLNDAVAPRVEPPAAESGAGFESLPASPNQSEKNHG